MIYKSCKEVEHSLFFILDILSFCCHCGSVGKFIYKDKYNGEIIDLNDFLRKREEFRNDFKKGIIDKHCENCANLVEKDWSEDFDIEHISIAHHSKCSCNCFYCNFAAEKKYWNKRKTYDIARAYKELLRTFKLRDNFHVDVVGGECCEYHRGELSTIINETIKSNGFLQFFSSGMFYSKEIASVLAQGKGVISISPDSGTKDVYEKIKRVRYYDKVWKNIEKYSSVIKNSTFPVMRIKYIIIPNLNDNIEEFNAFLEHCKKLNSLRIDISLEYSYFNHHKDEKIPDRLFSFLEYIRSFENKYDIVYKENAIPYLRKYRNDFKFE